MNETGEVDDPDRVRVAEGSDVETLTALFAQHRDRLRRMVKLRLDRRLQGRVDPSDVLQETLIDVIRRAREYTANPTMPPYLWLRFLTNQRLLATHRKHLGTRIRDAGQEISLHTGPTPQASSVSLAALLLVDSPHRHRRRREPRCSTGSRKCSTAWMLSIEKS